MKERFKREANLHNCRDVFGHMSMEFGEAEVTDAALG